MNHCRSLRRGKGAEIKSGRARLSPTVNFRMRLQQRFHPILRNFLSVLVLRQERDEINPAIDTRETSTARRRGIVDGIAGIRERDGAGGTSLVPGWMRAKQEPLVIQMGNGAASPGIYAAGKMMSSETFCIHPTPGRRIR